MSRFRALLATLRIANAPSVVSNVLLGYIVGWTIWFGEWMSTDASLITWGSPGGLCLSGLLLYFSGNLANDWHDVAWDKTRRPERALPSGSFRPATYLIAAILAALAGAALAFLENTACGICALVIIGLISIYTRFHKVAVWPVVPMGLCRAGLYFLGFLAFWPVMKLLGDSRDLRRDVFESFIQIATLAIGLFCYITGLTLSARYEGMADAPRGPRVISKALLVLPLPAMSCWFMPAAPLYGFIGMMPFSVWLTLCFTRFTKPIPRYVSALLAGIPLVDLIAATPIALSLAIERRQGVVNSHFAVTILCVPLAAFILGRLLQKVAPAT